MKAYAATNVLDFKVPQDSCFDCNRLTRLSLWYLSSLPTVIAHTSLLCELTLRKSITLQWFKRNNMRTSKILLEKILLLACGIVNKINTHRKTAVLPPVTVTAILRNK